MVGRPRATSRGGWGGRRALSRAGDLFTLVPVKYGAQLPPPPPPRVRSLRRRRRPASTREPPRNCVGGAGAARLPGFPNVRLPRVAMGSRPLLERPHELAVDAAHEKIGHFT